MEKLKHDKPGLPSSLYRPLTEGGVENIADAAFEVLEKSGMAVYSETAFEALKAAGAQTDSASRTVRFPRSMVEDAIASNPSSVTLHARDPEYNAVLEKNRVHYGTGGTAIYVIDPITGERRQSNLSDVALNARMVDALDHIHVFTINVFPNEITDPDLIDTNRFFHALNHTRKHVMGGIYSMKGCRSVVKMAEMIAGGEGALRAKPFVSFITLIISPFKIDDSYGEITCYLAQEHLPVVVPTEPICGTTAPITLAGNVLTHTAETLAGITLVQSVSRGAPGICGSVGSTTNLSNMDHLGGSIERAMINSAVSQMAQHFEIPLYSTGGTSDAKEVDVQAAYETSMSSLLVAMSGANYIHDIAGLMEADLTVAYDKLVLDNEILGMCQRVLRGVEVNDETLAKDLIIEKGPTEDYLTEEHTIEHMRDEFFVPKLANRDKREHYDAGNSALARARKYVQEFCETPPGNLLDENLRTQIRTEFPEIRDV
ncbi:trimethylamine methyltransferase family protein [Kiritimatiella glycovorans]|uniref:Trimethylamine:corrinoid methyltransferase n=1 Tax=Kiritimatiella glycovorans TaxID=1307763 RepID=A0A0G3EJL9_9BACT|nr:trimethylamine methyltransferase family protein [Kiritimatiella glycovorans]AKJ64990.1 trimethylamine:corrinoid methyltransferase [Kiritimatiella glycovorans]